MLMTQTITPPAIENKASSNRTMATVNIAAFAIFRSSPKRNHAIKTIDVIEKATVEKNTKLIDSRKFSHWTNEKMARLLISTMTPLASGRSLMSVNAKISGKETVDHMNITPCIGENHIDRGLAHVEGGDAHRNSDDEGCPGSQRPRYFRLANPMRCRH